MQIKPRVIQKPIVVEEHEPIDATKKDPGPMPGIKTKYYKELRELIQTRSYIEDYYDKVIVDEDRSDRIEKIVGSGELSDEVIEKIYDYLDIEIFKRLFYVGKYTDLRGHPVKFKPAVPRQITL
jgi:hypothetical protein